MLMMFLCKNLRKKSSEVCIITRSTPASLSFKGQVTKDTTVKRSIASYYCAVTTTLGKTSKTSAFKSLVERFFYPTERDPSKGAKISFYAAITLVNCTWKIKAQNQSLSSLDRKW